MNIRLRTVLGDKSVRVVAEDAAHVERIAGHIISGSLYTMMKQTVSSFGVTDNFKEIIRAFDVQPGKTPAGYRVEYELEADGLCRADLVRDLSYDEDGVKRPTRFLFSADSANPYEVESVKDLIANLTCNPAIIYNLFINNKEANVGGKFKTRDEVMSEIGRILGPGADISVELNNPFTSTTEEILAECEHFAKMLGKHRVVIKVPHTGPINAKNLELLSSGDERLPMRWNGGSVADKMMGHNLALLLHKHGYRVNFTLMFEPFQTALALQARPYFINTFVMFREQQTRYLNGLMKAYEATGDKAFIELMRDYMLANDYLGGEDAQLDAYSVLSAVKATLAHRLADPQNDGLDAMRHSLRALRLSNLPDTRLIICNFQDEALYPRIDRLMMSDEFADMADRIVITNPPALMSRYASSALVVQFQRRFKKAVDTAVN